MENTKPFTHEDCIETGYAMSIEGKVIVISLAALPEQYHNRENQLYYCDGGNGSRPNPMGRSIFAASLYDGVKMRWNRSDVVGVLKPELLPDWTKDMLEQIQSGSFPQMNL